MKNVNNNEIFDSVEMLADNDLTFVKVDYFDTYSHRTNNTFGAVQKATVHIEQRKDLSVDGGLQPS